MKTFSNYKPLLIVFPLGLGLALAQTPRGTAATPLPVTGLAREVARDALHRGGEMRKGHQGGAARGGRPQRGRAAPRGWPRNFWRKQVRPMHSVGAPMIWFQATSVFVFQVSSLCLNTLTWKPWSKPWLRPC